MESEYDSKSKNSSNYLYIILIILIIGLLIWLLLPEGNNNSGGNNGGNQGGNNGTQIVNPGGNDNPGGNSGGNGGTDTSSTLTLTLSGDATMSIQKGENYVEPGYTAMDTIEGDITTKVTKTNNVDTSKAGSYFIIYRVENNRGEVKQAIRVIKVTIDTSDAKLKISYTPEKLTNKDVTVTLKVSGDGYDYTTLPNDKKTTDTEITYKITENGTYTFKVKRKDGKTVKKTLKITNIDKTKPTGSCKSVVSGDKTTVTVTAKDDSGIKNYSYVVGSYKKVSTSNKYTVNEAITKKATVTVYDNAGNYQILSCLVSDPEPTPSKCPPSNVTISISTCYGGTILRRDVPLEEYLMGVLYGEEAPTLEDSKEYIKTFLIFARTYTLLRIGYSSTKTSGTLGSCSTYQNWCDLDLGCYRDNNQSMFDKCINYAISANRKDYTASTCANRLTTYPGWASVSNKTFYVSNPNWWGDKSATTTGIMSRWKGQASTAMKKLYQEMIDETAGLVIHTAQGKMPSALNYYECNGNDTSRPYTLCPAKSRQLAKQGYTMEQLIAAYTTAYPGRKVECFNK